jgi:hypothetical protein
MGTDPTELIRIRNTGFSSYLVGLGIVEDMQILLQALQVIFR